MEIFYIVISSINCKYEIGVNDFTMFKDEDGLQLHTEETFNHLIYNDSLLIQFDLKPINTQTFLSEIISFTCIIKTKNKVTKNETILFEYTFSEAANRLPSLNFKKLLPIKKQDFLPEWVNGEKLEINEKLVISLKDGYQNFWNLLKHSNIFEITKIITLKEKTYSECYGKSLKERLDLSISTYESYINDANYELFKFQPQFFQMKINCLGKVISLQDKDGFHPIFFLKKDMSESINIPLYFSKIENKFSIVL